jgi:bifunctional ADP-heptose synthase (sugar kinase/adenylyltransferase)
MNLAELCALLNRREGVGLAEAKEAARQWAARSGEPVFVTMAEKGMIGATPDGVVAHVESFPVRGPIDIVGAGDSVTANLGAALAAGASISEAMELAMAAASTVIHQLGTTGVATVSDLAALIKSR